MDHGRLALSMSPEWKALYFPPSDRLAVERRIPAGHLLGVRALRRRHWKVWLMVDEADVTKRSPLWTVEVRNSTAQAACLFALRKHEAPAVTVSTDVDGNVLSIEDVS